MTELEDFRTEKDEFFKNDPKSPLTHKQKEQFTGLAYFPEDPALRLDVNVQEFAEKTDLEVQASNGDVRIYTRYGQFDFMVEGQNVTLTIYEAEYGYFLPFVDSLAGKETYGAGRYLEPNPSGDGRFLIDFNQAYNPYCAYNERWSCPITPAENRVKVAIRAGEKMYGLP